MIANRNYKSLCQDITKVENYEDAKNDSELYVLHHLCECRYSSKELKEMNRYYNRPPEEFMFVPAKQHGGNPYLHKACRDNHKYNGLNPYVEEFKKLTGKDPIECMPYFKTWVKYYRPLNILST